MPNDTCSECGNTEIAVYGHLYGCSQNEIQFGGTKPNKSDPVKLPKEDEVQPRDS